MREEEDRDRELESIEKGWKENRSIEDWKEPRDGKREEEEEKGQKENRRKEDMKEKRDRKREGSKEKG